MYLSVISPVYKAEKIVDLLIKRIIQEVSKITEDFEIILVEDGSPDDSWQRINDNCTRDNRIKGIKLSRNFGQHYAITAGLDYAKGQWVVVMDCDLQDLPEEIPNLYQKAIEGYSIVLARRDNRQDSFIKKLSSRIFYKVLSYLSGVKHDSTIANFGIYSMEVIEAILKMRESIRYFPTMISWVGFNKCTINVKHAARAEGKTSYNFNKLLKLALDIILAYSDKPIRLTIQLGLIISFISIILTFFTVFFYLKGNIIVPGYTSLIISVWFLSGIIVSILGMIGLYIGKTFEGVKNRPLYIIEKIQENEY